MAVSNIFGPRLAYGLLSLIAATACMPATYAQAQKYDDAQRDAQGQQHFHAARKHYNEGNYSEAAQEFDKSYRLSGRPSLLYNLYLAASRAGQQRRAYHALIRYLDEETTVENRAELQTTARNLEAELTTAESSQAEPPRSTDSENLKLTHPASMNNPWPYVFGAVGSGLLLTGGLALAMALSQRSDANQFCSDGICMPGYEGALSRYESTQTIAISFLISGAVLGTVAIVWGLLSADAQGSESERRATASQHASPAGFFAF